MMLSEHGVTARGVRMLTLYSTDYLANGSPSLRNVSSLWEGDCLMTN